VRALAECLDTSRALTVLVGKLTRGRKREVVGDAAWEPDFDPADLGGPAGRTHRSQGTRGGRAYQKGRLDSADAFPIIDALRREQTKIRSELAAARQRQEEAERSSLAQERWDTWTVVEQRAWIKARVQAVIIRPATPGARAVKETDIEIVPK
jgi:hypothetical protein